LVHDIETKPGNNKIYSINKGFARPVIIHRAILGSIERFIAILTEHTAGKWPFFVSPR
jgi:threonyl-tRNA synthetase